MLPIGPTAWRFPPGTRGTRSARRKATAARTPGFKGHLRFSRENGTRGLLQKIRAGPVLRRPREIRSALARAKNRRGGAAAYCFRLVDSGFGATPAPPADAQRLGTDDDRRSAAAVRVDGVRTRQAAARPRDGTLGAEVFTTRLQPKTVSARRRPVVAPLNRNPPLPHALQPAGHELSEAEIAGDWVETERLDRHCVDTPPDLG